MFTRSVALGLLASAASAFDASSSSNVAMYWGQGSSQISLKELCSDPSVDIVSMGFVNQFPKQRGEYPSTNFANACDEVFYKDDFGNQSGLRSSCPTIPEGIKTCHENGKKVLLSIGGGYPIDYYLETQDIAEYLADFLWGAFGPPDDEWKSKGMPRPFGDQYVDGFDLDLEALIDPAPFVGYQSANYHYMVSRWKNVHFPSKSGDFYISSAPQCVVPDSRLADTIMLSHFDFVFAQFYNTPLCNARRGFEDLGLDTTTFTFDTWAIWLGIYSIVNPHVKLYLGLPADKLAAPSDTTAYLEPIEANDVITFYKNKHPDIFGGVMLWEATFNAENTCGDSGPTYSTNIKAILQGSYEPRICPTPVSSIIASTSAVAPSGSALSSSISLGTGASSVVTPIASAPFPTISNPTSVQLPSGTAPSIITPSGSLPIGTGASSIVVPSVSAPFPISANSSVPHPTGTGVSIVTPVPIGTGAYSIKPVSAPYPTSNASSIRPYGTGVAVSAPYPILNGSHSAYPTAASSTSEKGYPMYTAPGYSAGGYPVYTAPGYGNGQGHSVPAGFSYPAKAYNTGEGQDGYSAGKASVTSKPGYAASSPAAVTTTCYTTTYVDICSTGFTTLTATVTKTYTACPKCVAPTPTPNEVPQGWYTTVAVCNSCGPKTTTVTLTKPQETPTGAVNQGAQSSPAGTVPPHQAASSSPQSLPQGKGSSVPVAQPSSAVSVTNKVYVTVVPVPASKVPATSAPYVSANGTAAYVPSGTASGTAAHVPSGMASSTGKGVTAYTKTPVPSNRPVVWEGAASRFSMGVSGVAVLVAGVLLL